MPAITATADLLKEWSDAIEKFWKNDRTLFISVVVIFILLMVFLTWNSTLSMKEQRESFLQQMDRSDDKIINTMNHMSDALNKNSEIMYDLKNAINK